MFAIVLSYRIDFRKNGLWIFHCLIGFERAAPCLADLMKSATRGVQKKLMGDVYL